MKRDYQRVLLQDSNHAFQCTSSLHILLLSKWALLSKRRDLWVDLSQGVARKPLKMKPHLFRTSTIQLREGSGVERERTHESPGPVLTGFEWSVDESDGGESWRVHSDPGSNSSSSSSSSSSSNSSSNCGSHGRAQHTFAPETVADLVSTALTTSQHDAAIILSACRPPEQRAPTAKRAKFEERYFSSEPAHACSVSVEAKMLGSAPTHSYMFLTVKKFFTSFGKLNVYFEPISLAFNFEIRGNYDSRICGNIVFPKFRSTFPNISKPGYHRSNLRSELRSTAGVVYLGARLLAGRFLAALLQAVHHKSILPIAMYTFFMSDETTMPLGDVMWLDAAGKPGLREERTVGKIVQNELVLGFLLQNQRNRRFVFWTVPIALPLQITDKARGASFVHLWQVAMSLPLMSEVRAIFKLQYDGKCLDRASANVSAVRELESMAPHMLFFLFWCMAHMLSTITGRSLSPVDGVITGIIALSLSQRMGGETSRFFNCLVHVIVQSVVPVQRFPHNSMHPWSQYRDHLLTSMLPAHKDFNRRSSLRVLLTGDLTSDDIEWLTIDIPTDEEIRDYAERLAQELFPQAFETWCRSRWLTSLAIIREVSLLSNVHGLLQRALKMFCATSKFEQKADAMVVKEWSVASSDDEAVRKTPQQPQAQESKPVPGGDWSAWNAKQLRDTRHFAQSEPGGILLIIVMCMTPAEQMMQRMEKSDADTEENTQSCKAASKLPFQTRAEYFASLEMTNNYYSEVETLMFDERTWALLPSKDRTVRNANIAFAMLATGMCGVFFSIEAQCKDLAIFKLIKQPDVAEELLRQFHTCKDMLPRSTLQFLKRFPTVSDLVSADSRRHLLCLALLLRFVTQRLECRWAQLRRQLFNRIQCPRMGFQDAASLFLFLRQNKLENRWKHKETAQEAPTQPKRRKRAQGKDETQNAGGGGQRRAAFSDILKNLGAGGKHTKEERSALFKEAHYLASNAGADNLKKWSEVGEAGTARYRQTGQRSFGQHKRVVSGTGHKKKESMPQPGRFVPQKKRGAEVQVGHLEDQPVMPSAPMGSDAIVAYMEVEQKLWCQKLEKAAESHREQIMKETKE